MKKWILSTLFLGTLFFGATVPENAEALKIKLQPSVMFSRSYHRSRPVVHHRPAPVYSYYPPYYYPVEYGYYYPVPIYECPECYYYYPCPHHVRSSGVDFQVQFKVR